MVVMKGESLVNIFNENGVSDEMLVGFTPMFCFRDVTFHLLVGRIQFGFIGLFSCFFSVARK